MTGSLVLLCFVVRRHYRRVASILSNAFSGLERIQGEPGAAPGPPDPAQPTAAVLVASNGGRGIHTALNVLRTFPNHFRNLVFLSVGVIDSGRFKGEDSVELLRAGTEETLRRYADLGRRLGVPSTYRLAIGTDAVDEAEKLCLEVAREFPRTTFFAGQVLFQRETWFQRLLHNQTAYAIQRRLQWGGMNLVILAARVR